MIGKELNIKKKTYKVFFPNETQYPYSFMFSRETRQQKVSKRSFKTTQKKERKNYKESLEIINLPCAHVQLSYWPPSDKKIHFE